MKLKLYEVTQHDYNRGAPVKHQLKADDFWMTQNNGAIFCIEQEKVAFFDCIISIVEILEH